MPLGAPGGVLGSTGEDNFRQPAGGPWRVAADAVDRHAETQGKTPREAAQSSGENSSISPRSCNMDTNQVLLRCF
jgi:hypothetical protein